MVLVRCFTEDGSEIMAETPSSKKFQFNVFLNLIRSLFPHWNFFDQTAFTFELLFKDVNLKNWQLISFSQQRPLLGIFYNPVVNGSLAQFNIVEHFANDILETKKEISEIDSKLAHNLPSYNLMRSLIETKLNELKVNAELFQFKIIARSKKDSIDIFISDPLKLSQL